MFLGIQKTLERPGVVKLRVLQIIHNLELAGAEVLLRDLILGFIRRGIECELYLLQSTDSPLQRCLLEHGAKIHAPLRASVYSPLHVRALAAHFRRHAYDIAHVHLFPAQLWVALATRVAGVAVRLLTTEHSAYNYRRSRIYRPIDRWTYAHYHCIAGVSEATTEALVNWLPEVGDRSRTCPDGIDADVFANAPAASKPQIFSLPETCPVILSVGRMVHQKDHETVIRALSLTPEAHLALVGAGPMRPKYEALARKLAIAHRVHFLGQRTDVPQLMKAADIFVQSSRFEGFGIAALEAMASGLPVVASRVPGLAELVAGAGLLFEPGDHQELATHLSSLLNQRSLVARLAEAGQARASEFSLKKTVECYEKVYREMVAQ